MGFSPESYTVMTMWRQQKSNSNFIADYLVFGQPLKKGVISEKTVYRVIKVLKNFGYISRQGDDSNGKCVIVSQ